MNWRKYTFLEFGWVRFHSWIPRQTKATETKGHSPNWILFSLWSCKTRWKTSTKLICGNKFHGSAARGFWLRSIVDSEGEGGVNFCRKTLWRLPWTCHVSNFFAFCRIPNNKICKCILALRICTEQKYDWLWQLFTLCWYSCFVPQLGIPTSLQFFGKKEKRNTVQR